MDMCWNEEPALRPAFLRVRTFVQNTIKKSGDNIVDHLIKRMETYAANLETQVFIKKLAKLTQLSVNRNVQRVCRKKPAVVKNVTINILEVMLKTKEFMEEQQRAAGILQEMLPK